VGWTLAITGKGGVGKSTLAAMAVRWLSENGHAPVLAVDADPNMCLDALLGVQVQATIGGVREEARAIAQGGMSSGISKQELLDIKVQGSLVEMGPFDLIAMGRPEGPGCYCYANNVLRGVLAKLAGQYPAVVIDNEAGLENLSRRTVQRTDWLIFVADPSARGIITARRLFDLALDMDMAASSMGLIINRAQNGAPIENARQAFAETPVQLLGAMPENAVLAEHDARGDSVFSLDSDNPVYQTVDNMMRRMLGGNASTSH